MPTDDTTAVPEKDPDEDGGSSHSNERRRALTFVWGNFARERVGEVAYLEDSGPWTWGRGDVGSSALFYSPPLPHGVRRRALEHATVSADHLRIKPHARGILVDNRGRANMRINGGDVVTGGAIVSEGDVIEIEDVASFLYGMRAASGPHMAVKYPMLHVFGRPDLCGIVGESDLIWRVRAAMATAAASKFHVAIHGDTGTGKELVASGIHTLWLKAGEPFVACNISAFPETLVASEIFGLDRNYPNAGMPERIGLIGRAEGGTLFIDEVGEVPAEVLAMLLRALDKGGSYYRFGSHVARIANVRFV